MTYELEPEETLSRGIRRIAREQVAGAIQQLLHSPDLHEAVHDARKRCKKMRAVVRLARGELGPRFASENAFYRDTARRLSEARDAQAMVESWDKLAARFPEEINGRWAQAVHRGLSARRDALAGSGGDLPTIVTEVVAELRTALRRIRRWPLEENRFAAVRPGLGRTFRSGRGALAQALDEPSDANLHEWRKQVKYHWYHSRILVVAWPAMMGPWRDALGELSTLLGDDHDLALLRDRMTEEVPRGARCHREEILELFDRRRKELQERAFVLGRRIYAESREAFEQRLERWWQASRTEQ